MSELEEKVCLRVEGEVFYATREELSLHSSYFRAMFSGHYREAEQQVVDIQIIDAKSMREILAYMRTGDMSIPKKEAHEVGRLLPAATFFQMDALIRYIESLLLDAIDLQTWLDILDVVETCHAHEVARRAAAFGLYSFLEMFAHVHRFKELARLQWYLSHSHLAADSELQVFQLGVKWLEMRESEHPDAILMVLGSLALHDLSDDDLALVSGTPAVVAHARAAHIVGCLRAARHNHIPEENIQGELTNEFSREVCEETGRLVAGAVRRACVRVPCITASAESPRIEESAERERVAEAQYLYRWRGAEGGLERWLRVSEARVWGWTWAAWGTHRVVVAGGERGRGSGRYVCGVRVYDTLSRSWSEHDAQLPARRHAGCVVHHDTLYLVGGVGSFRMVLSSAIAYDLVGRTYRSLPDLPEMLQSPAVVVHRDELYVAGQYRIYTLRDNWKVVAELPMRMSSMVSVRGELCLAQTFHQQLLRLDLDTGHTSTKKLYSNYITAICQAGGQLVAFTEEPMFEKPMSFVELECGTVWTDEAHKLRYSGVAGCAAVAIELPPLRSQSSAAYALQCLHSMSK